MSFNHIIVQMPINATTLEWARCTSPHLIQTEYSNKRNDYLLLSRSLLEYILQQHFNIPELPDIAYLEHGKPYFIHYPKIAFNITHTDTSMAIIVANDHPVGIDIETIKIRRNFQGLEERVLHAEEQAWLTQQANYLKSFFTLWSAKEAYLKATGTGLAGLASLELDMNKHLANGILQQGYLYIDKAPITESFVCYLPNEDGIPNLYSFNGRNLELSSREWLTIKCCSHHPNNIKN
jgi:phosphopantetheinyl transferase